MAAQPIGPDGLDGLDHTGKLRNLPLMGEMVMRRAKRFLIAIAVGGLTLYGGSAFAAAAFSDEAKALAEKFDCTDPDNVVAPGPPDDPATFLTASIYCLLGEAEKGNVRAYVQVGDAYAAGILGPRDYDEALRWYKLAADANQPDGYTSMAFVYEAGTGVERDLTKARFWLEKAAAAGETKARTHLAKFLLHGAGGPADPERAAILFRQSADQNDPIALYALGRCYFEGQGVTQDTAQGLVLIEQAIAQSPYWTPAVYVYLSAHYKEHGPVEDFMKWTKLAADEGHPRSLFWLGQIYETGAEGINPDADKTKYFFQKVIQLDTDEDRLAYAREWLDGT